MQDARAEISALGMEALNAFPPMIWCTYQKHISIVFWDARRLLKAYGFYGNAEKNILFHSKRRRQGIEVSLTVRTWVQAWRHQRIETLNCQLRAAEPQMIQASRELRIHCGDEEKCLPKHGGRVVRATTKTSNRITVSTKIS